MTPDPLPLAAASRRLRRPPGRPRRVVEAKSRGVGVESAALGPAKTAGEPGDFAASLPPRGLPLPAAATYSGLPVRRLWTYIADGLLRPIRPPGCRRVLVDRLDLDRLLDGWKVPAGEDHRARERREAKERMS